MPQSAPSPIAPPALPAPAAPYLVRLNNSAVAAYDAALAQREELGQQLDRLKGERANLAEEIRSGTTAGADRGGVDARMAATDARIAALDKQVAQADLKLAESAAVPGAVSGHRSEQRWINQHERGSSPDALIAIPIVFFIFVLSPLSIAFSRRLWRRGAAAPVALHGDLAERMSRLDQAVESIAIEVERIGEGQRFMTKVLSESGARSLASTPDR